MCRQECEKVIDFFLLYNFRLLSKTRKINSSDSYGVTSYLINGAHIYLDNKIRKA